MSDNGISGVAVGVVTAGALLIYAGYRGVSPLQALRDVTSGATPPGLSTGTGGVVTTGADTVGAAIPGSATLDGPGFGAGLVAAVQRYAGDRYSQVRRWDDGWSDCSSFVGKGLRVLGITPPGASTTWDYVGWAQLRQINRNELAAGDLCANTAHIIVATASGSAIGQQNTFQNVRTGSPEDLMAGTGSFMCLRWIGKSTKDTATVVRAPTPGPAPKPAPTPITPTVNTGVGGSPITGAR